MNAPQSVIDILQEDVTSRGIQQWWERYLESDPEGDEDRACERARQLVAQLERAGDYV